MYSSALSLKLTFKLIHNIEQITILTGCEYPQEFCFPRLSLRYQLRK